MLNLLTPNIAADPMVQYMSKAQMEKSIERTRKLMQEAAKKLEFIEAAQYRRIIETGRP